jgi:hypothetical protein
MNTLLHHANSNLLCHATNSNECVTFKQTPDSETTMSSSGKEYKRTPGQQHIMKAKVNRFQVVIVGIPGMEQT